MAAAVILLRPLFFMSPSDPPQYKTISGYRLRSLDPAGLEHLLLGVKKFGVERIRLSGASQLSVSGLSETELENFCRFISTLLRPDPGNGITSILSCSDCGSCRNAIIDSRSIVHKLAEMSLPRPLPAKIKIGVAGCMRCCTMPRIRDVGLIPVSARTGHWNVYFGGNGGRRPRIGDLIGTKLSERDCLELVRSALIIYQREADKNMRTAEYLRKTTPEVFLEKLDNYLAT
jgi:NAD(P)H-nitrite reductase large subunit